MLEGVIIRISKPEKKRLNKEQPLVVQSLAGKVGQHEAGAVDVLVVVAAETLLLLARPGARGLAHVAVGVLAADHEADLAGGVGGDGGVGVFGDGEDLLAGLAEVGDQGEVQPLVFGCGGRTLTQNHSRDGRAV